MKSNLGLKVESHRDALLYVTKACNESTSIVFCFSNTVS